MGSVEKYHKFLTLELYIYIQELNGVMLSARNL